MIGSTFVSWELVQQVIQDSGLDRLQVTAGPRSQRIIEATGAENVAAAIAYVQQHVAGDVTVTAWSAAERKTSAYVWSVRNAQGTGAIAGTSDHGNANITLLEKLYETKLQLALLQHEKDNGDADKYDRIATLAESLGPQLIAALTGRQAPPAIARRPPAPAQPEPGEALNEEELREALADVVAFARIKPSAARQALAMVRAQLPAEDATDNPSTP